MSFQFRRRAARRRVGPVSSWLNVSGSGVSQSVRVGPVTVNAGPRGLRLFARTPVRGLSWRGRL